MSNSKGFGLKMFSMSTSFSDAKVGVDMCDIGIPEHDSLIHVKVGGNRDPDIVEHTYERIADEE